MSTSKYAVICSGDTVEGSPYNCGKVELTNEQYHKQMLRPDSGWHCPNCGSTADWDDATYDEYCAREQK